MRLAMKPLIINSRAVPPPSPINFALFVAAVVVEVEV